MSKKEIAAVLLVLIVIAVVGYCVVRAIGSMTGQ